jgi:hypothetical protein
MKTQKICYNSKTGCFKYHISKKITKTDNNIVLDDLDPIIDSEIPESGGVYAYIDMANVFPNINYNSKNNNWGEKVTINKNLEHNKISYAPLVYWSVSVGSSLIKADTLNNIINNPKLEGLNIFTLSNTSIPSSTKDDQWILAKKFGDAGISGRWLNDGSDNYNNVVSIWKEYFKSLRSAFPNLKIGVSFGGSQAPNNYSELPSFINKLNENNGMVNLMSILYNYQVYDFIEFDIEFDWTNNIFDPSKVFATYLHTFMTSFINYPNCRIRIGATNPVGSSMGAGTGAYNGVAAQSGAPKWIKDYDNMDFIVYTYGVCTSTNLFDPGNPWIPKGDNVTSFLPKNLSQIQFAFTGYGGSHSCPSNCNPYCEQYNYVLSGLKGNTSNFLKKIQNNYGPSNIFWLEENTDGTSPYPYSNTEQLLNILGKEDISQKYECKNGNCVLSSKGLSKAECEQICKGKDYTISEINIDNSSLIITYH